MSWLSRIFKRKISSADRKTLENIFAISRRVIDFADANHHPTTTFLCSDNPYKELSNYKKQIEEVNAFQAKCKEIIDLFTALSLYDGAESKDLKPYIDEVIAILNEIYEPDKNGLVSLLVRSCDVYKVTSKIMSITDRVKPPLYRIMAICEVALS